MITLLEGSPGHGKSYTLVREIAESVRQGKLVATNVPLREDWAEVMARWTTLAGGLRRHAVTRKAEGYRRLVFISDDLDELLLVRFDGKGEGRGKLIIDESHRDLNARVRDKGRVRVINHVSAHRHYGMDVLLATQDEMNIDRQIRSLCEWHSVVRNFRRFPVVSLLHINIFLRITRWNDRAKTRATLPQIYGLSKRLARLYDTHALEDKDWPEDAIILPHPPAQVAVRARKAADAQPTAARSVIAFMDSAEPELSGAENENGRGKREIDGGEVVKRKRRMMWLLVPIALVLLLVVAFGHHTVSGAGVTPRIPAVGVCRTYAISGPRCVGHESTRYEREERVRGESVR